MNGPEALLLELFVIFVAAKVLGEVFERLSLSAVLGEILAGICLGPYALGLIHPSDTLHSVAELGAIFVLFSAGLETSPRDLIRVGNKALQVAVAGVIVPFVLGFAYMKLHGDATREAVFVGAAVFDDILGMVLLAVVAGLASGNGLGWLHLGVLIVEAATFALFMIFIAPRIVHRMQPRVEHLSTQNASLVVALALCLFLSWLASTIGMAAIIGAFFAGLMFADYAPEWNLIPRVGGITEFLSPYFFFTIGTRLNPQLFTSKVLDAAIIVSLLAIVSKVAGCGLPLLREGRATVLRVGFGMMPRGEVALIVALVGLQSQIVTPTTYGIVVFMTGITTLLAPPILRYLFHGETREIEEHANAAHVHL